MPRTRAQTAAATLTLAALPDDALLQVIDACANGYTDEVPLFEAVKGLVCSKALWEQFHRLRPLVAVRSLAVVQRPNHGPWGIVLLYKGTLAAAVLTQARKGRVRSIDTTDGALAAPALARRVVPELLGAGCSLLDLRLNHVRLHYWQNGLLLSGTWAAAFGKAVVCSAVLRALHLVECGLQGPLPDLKLLSLQDLDLSKNQLTGGLEPMQRCGALRELCLSCNHLTGGLDPLRNCTALRILALADNDLAGRLEPLQACTALQYVLLNDNILTGGLEPLRGCKELRELDLSDNQLIGVLDPLRKCTALWCLDLGSNQMTGTLEPLQGCTALQTLALHSNCLTGDLEALRGCTALQELNLSANQLTGGLEPLRRCTALHELDLSDNEQLTGGFEPIRGCTDLQVLGVNNTQLLAVDEDGQIFCNVRSSLDGWVISL